MESTTKGQRFTSVRALLLRELEGSGILSTEDAQDLQSDPNGDFEMSSLQGVDLINKASKQLSVEIKPKELAKSPERLCSLNEMARYLGHVHEAAKPTSATTRGGEGNANRS